MSRFALKTIALILLSSFIIGCGKKSNKDDYAGKTAEQIYAQSKANIEDKRYHLAIKDLEALEARFPYGKYSDKAQIGLAFVQYKSGEYETALAEADRFLHLHPKNKDADYAYYLKGLINFDRNFSAAFKYMPLDRSKREPTFARQSFDDFKVLLEKYPSSKYAPDARKRMITLKNQLAHHELHIAKYYLDKGAYLAAANRANYILNKFDKSTATEDALITMVKAYQKLGMDELANDAIATLKRNFPNSPEIKKSS